MTTVKSCLTSPTDSGCSYTAATNLPALVSSVSSDLTPVKECLTDPTATACTGTYSAAASLPKIASNIASCMTDPTSSTCTTAYSASSTLPKTLTSKCDQSTCTTLTTDMTTVKSCLTSPTDSGCSGTYSASTTLPGKAETDPTWADCCCFSDVEPGWQVYDQCGGHRLYGILWSQRQPRELRREEHRWLRQAAEWVSC